jgi:2C-methyl-D-erythritol 2,4-cyclodiphosphate synthase
LGVKKPKIRLQVFFINKLNNEYVASDIENRFPHKKDKNKQAFQKMRIKKVFFELKRRKQVENFAVFVELKRKKQDCLQCSIPIKKLNLLVVNQDNKIHIDDYNNLLQKV